MQTLDGTIWKAVESFAFDTDGRELPSPLGRHPLAVIMFDDGRIVAAVAERSPPGSPSEVLISYTGPYRFDGAELVTDAEIASRSDLVTKQIRSVRFETPTRMVISPRNDVLGGKAALRLSVVWERVR